MLAALNLCNEATALPLPPAQPPIWSGCRWLPSWGVEEPGPPQRPRVPQRQTSSKKHRRLTELASHSNVLWAHSVHLPVSGRASRLEVAVKCGEAGELECHVEGLLRQRGAPVPR